MEFFDLTPAEQKEANRREPVVTTQTEFKNALTALGIVPGTRLVVHSAFSSLGSFEGGAEALCRTLMEQVTEQGTLMMPGLSCYPADGEAYVYDPATTPVRVGIVPDTFRRIPGVVRSWDPTHSFCVWGEDKESFIREHHLVPTMDPRSPLGLLEAADGRCLMIGCYRSVTFMHVVETSCGAGCLGQRTERHEAVLLGKKVRMRGWGWRSANNCRARTADELFSLMREQGMVAETMLHRCHLVAFQLKNYRKALEHFLKDPVKGCASCTLPPRKVDRTVESDWDPVHRRLLESEAFRGPYETAE